MEKIRIKDWDNSIRENFYIIFSLKIKKKHRIIIFSKRLENFKNILFKPRIMRGIIKGHTTEKVMEEIFLELAWNVYYAMIFLKGLMEIEMIKRGKVKTMNYEELRRYIKERLNKS